MDKIVDPQQIVKLDISGTFYNVSLRTLTTIPGSSLRLMFSDGTDSLEKVDGRVFIERNGKVFGLLLDFLRESMIPIFKNQYLRTQFELEIEYWQMQKSHTFLKASYHSKLREIFMEAPFKQIVFDHSVFFETYNSKFGVIIS